jgi:DNA repair exonuclease SbcCD ATPase subunit
LQQWLRDELPGQRAQLTKQKSHLDQRAAQRKQDQQLADKKYLDSQKALEKCSSALTQRDLFLNSYTTLQAELAQARSDWKDLEETVEYNPLEETVLKEALKEAQQQANLLSEKATLYNQISQLQQTLVEKQNTLKQHTEARGKLQQQQVELGYQSEVHQAAQKDLDTQQTTLAETKQEQIVAQAKFEQARASARQAKQTLAWAIDHHDRFETSVREFYKEDRLYTLLDEFKKHFFEANTKEVFIRTTQLLQHAITDQSILGIQFDGQNLSYLDASGATRPVSRLSGGEKSLVGLCLRVALAEQAQAIIRTGKVSFLILDEVLSSLDDERCSAVQRIFEDVQQRGIFEHILMITHLDSVKQGWRAAGLEVRRKDIKTSEVIPIAPGAV